jgi:hypothetical protein
LLRIVFSETFSSRKTNNKNESGGNLEMKVDCEEAKHDVVATSPST